MGFRHGPGSQHMMNNNNYDLFWIVITGVLLLIILFLIYKLVQKSKHSRREVDTSNQALDILKERYAKGELTDEEFTRKKEMLSNNN